MGTRNMSVDSVGKTAGEPAAAASAPGKHVATAVAEETEPAPAAAGVGTAGSDEAVKAMLADLDALQREVEAARAAAAGSGGVGG